MSDQKNENGLSLGARCAGCGHPASVHPSDAHAAAYLARHNGQYAATCAGREGNHVNQFGPIACVCRATCERVSASKDHVLLPGGESRD